MSALGNGEVLSPILLRSSTPGANEKVLHYLEGMSREGDEPDTTAPRSLADTEDYQRMLENQNSPHSPPQRIYSPAPRSQANHTLPDLPSSPTRYTNGNNANHDDINGDDADSNVQEGVRSEGGDTALPLREPGPHDPPGPKYESYDSGPSFGNFGPLPVDDGVPAAHASWNQTWMHNIGKPTPPVPWSLDMRMTLGQPTKAPISDVAKSPSLNPRPLQSKASNKAQSTFSGQEAPTPPKEGSRSQSRAATNREQAPMSPVSARSKLMRGTEKGTVYPPLPESRMGDGDTHFDVPTSPMSKARARSKAASISPSDSPSQAMKPTPNGQSRSPLHGSVLSGGGGHQSRPFSPYRHAPTTEDLLHAAVRGRALVIPEEEEKESTKPPSNMPSRPPSNLNGGKAPSQISIAKQRSVANSKPASSISSPSRPRSVPADRASTPTPARPHSPEGLDPEEAQIVHDALMGVRTPRTSYYAASLEPEFTSHYHDPDLCALLHKEGDASLHEVVRKALRKAVRQRVKKLGMNYDTESIKQYKKSYYDHDPSVHHRSDNPSDEPPSWATDIKRELVLMQQRIESLGPKIENLTAHQDRSFGAGGSRFAYEGDEYTTTPRTQTVNIQTQPTGTLADSMYHSPDIEVELDENGNEREFDDMTETQTQRPPRTDGETRSQKSFVYGMSDGGRDDSPGQQFLEEELYKLRQKKPQESQLSHHTWEIARDDAQDDFEEDNGHPVAPSGIPTIPDANVESMDRDGSSSPPLPALPGENDDKQMAVHPQGPWNSLDYGVESQQLPPWQRIHARLLSWAIIWSSNELEHALNSTTRGQQVDEAALSIWSTQTYKRYVRARLTDSPQGIVDRLFVPPNMADAISNAVFNGRHGDACGMLRDLWSPFGLEGMPRLIVVLAKHRSDPNHWVVHRFSLPDGNLTTYDSYPERTLPDGRPLGWWFAIRVAWPNATYPSPDHLMQKMVRLHRPLQLPIDNSVAAAGIWRNILMGSRAERSLDLERLRDLINTEVKNLKQRKLMGKLSIGGPRQPPWEDIN